MQRGEELRWPAVVLVAAVPLVVDPAGHHRYTALRFLIAAAVVTVGLGAGFYNGSLRVPRRLGATWVVLLIVTGLATVFGLDPLLGALGDSVRLMGLTTAVVTFGAFILGASGGTGGARRITDGLLAGGIVVVAVGIAQLAGVGGHSGRVGSSLGNPGFLGAYLCLLIPVATARILGDRRPPIWSGVLLAGAFVVLIGTGSRGAWVGASVALGLLAVLRGRRAVAGGLAAVAVVMVIAGLTVSRDTGRGRLDTWMETLPVVAQRPVLGWGPESFRTGYARNVSAQWVRRYSLEQIPDRAHNRFLDIAAATGLAGLVVDLVLIAGVAAAARGRLRNAVDDPANWWALAGIAGALTGWLVQGQFLFDTFDLTIMAWVLAGVLAAGVPSFTPTAKVVGAIGMLATAAVVALAAAGFGADRRIQSASGLRPALSLERLASATRLRPRTLDAHLLAAEVAVRSGDPAVLRSAHRLLKGWHDDAIRVADARVLLRMGRASEAAAIFGSVVTREPANAQAWLGAGAALQAERRFDEAVTALRQADHLLPHSPVPSLELAGVSFARGHTAEGCRYVGIARTRPGAPPDPEIDLFVRSFMAEPCALAQLRPQPSPR